MSHVHGVHKNQDSLSLSLSRARAHTQKQKQVNYYFLESKPVQITPIFILS